MKNDISGYQKELLDRFLRYVKFETTSDESEGDKGKFPSTDSQVVFIKELAAELKRMGILDVTVDRKGYLRAYLPSNAAYADDQEKRIFGFISHADTSPEVSARNVRPIVHDSYDGEKIQLSETEIDPAEYPDLLRYRGQTVVTSDGTTLLGADDKAGIAEIFTAVSWLAGHPEVCRHGMEIFITPDEEIGHGTDNFPLKRIKSDCLYTVDGDIEGCIEAECFNAYSAKITITGVSIHPGSGKGKLVNAGLIGARFLSMLPANETPEATEGREGFFCPVSISGGIEKCEISMIIRDFETAGMERRIKLVEQIAETLKNIYPGAGLDLEFSCSYLNMRDFISQDRKCLEYLEKAVSASGIEPVYKLIRGGTDGSRLSEMGFPCPNIFTGGSNFHSRKEWVALPAMMRTVDVIINLVTYDM